MKKIALILFASMLMGQAWAANYDFSAVCSSGQTLFYKKTGSNTVAVTSQNNDLHNAYDIKPYGDLIIPKTVTNNGITYNVTSISKYAFYWCFGLTSVIIPNTVTSIGNSAFADISGLRFVTIPNSVTSIGTDVFRRIDNLIRYYEEDNSKPGWNPINYFWNVKAQVTEDFVYGILCGESPASAMIIQYKGDSILANIPASVMLDGKEYEVVSIAKDAFKGYDNLDYTAFGNAFYIGNDDNPYLILVSAKNKKIESCEINSKCRFIYDEAFCECTKLTEISIPESVIAIGTNAFKGCTGLQKSEFASVGHICGICFANNFSNPLTLTHHFYINSTEVTNLVVPNSVVNIGDYAFYDCNGLVSISIPESVKSIGVDAFGFTGNRVYGYVNGTYGAYYEYYSSLRKAEFASIESLCNIDFSNSTANPLYFAHQLFIGGDKVINLDIPKTVNSIGNYAIINCTSLSAVSIPESVISIGTQAFSGCNRLASVEIPNSVTSIGAEAFSDCSYLKSLSYNSNAIGAHFNNISALQSIFIGDSIKNISGSEFSGCDNLVNVISMAAVPPTLNGDPYTYADTIYVPAASVETYKSAPVWKRKEILPLDYYTVKTSTANAERGTVSTGGQYAAMQAVTVYATPAENYHFKAWSDGNTENPRTIMIEGDVNVTAVFEGDSRTVNVSANSSAFGSAVGAESYHYGDTVTFTATPAVGYHFVGWSDSVTTNPRVWVVTEDSTFNAVFEINKYAIAATADANGSVEGDSTYNHGTTAVLNAIANEGYHFVKWSDDVTDNPRSVTATSDSAFTAVFEINTYTITASAENGSVSGADTYNYGATATLTATPTEGYHFVKWSDGNTDNPRSYIVTNDVSLAAIFAGHTIVTDAVVAATCTATGLSEGSHCSVCGEILVEQTVTPKAEHTVIVDAAVEATCTATGLTEGSHCSVCGKVIVAQQTIPVGKHTVVTDPAVAATATSTGLTEGSHCSVCGKVIVAQTVIPALGENQGGNEGGQQGNGNQGNENQGGNNEGNENQGGNNEGNENQGGNENNPGTAVAESAANAINIYAHGNIIVVENATEEICVYDAMGRLVGRDARPCISTEIRVNNTGLYIVKVGNVVKRVMIN